jgi:outer membrane protein assembly factor BamB
VYSSPAIDCQGRIYIGSDDGSLYALEPDGSLAWSHETAGRVLTTPAIAPDGTIYFGSEDGFLYAMTPQGKLQWSFAADGPIRVSSPSLATDGTIYFGTDSGVLHAVAPDGSERWSISLGGFAPINTRPLIDGSGAVYVGSELEQVYLIDASGQELAVFDVNASASSWDPPSDMVLRDDGMLMVGSGSVLWAIGF